MNITHRILSLCVLLPLSLGGCGGSPAVPAKPDAVPSASVVGARNAVAYTLSVLTVATPVVRRAALLGIYVNLHLADGLAVPVTAARAGIEAQLRLHSFPTDEAVDNLYSLLEEFGTVLQVDIADLLNRSENRAETLDLYVTGLSNITERSRRRAADIKEQIAALKAQEKERKSALTAIDKEIKNAVKAKDFATAQAKQPELVAAQTALTETQLKIKEMTTLQSTFTELLGIAEKRLAALDGNREVLIAGLKVVDVPGVEDLGVLQKAGTRKRSGGVTNFGGL